MQGATPPVSDTFTTAAVWFALALGATLLARHLRASIALVEICVGTFAGALAQHYGGPEILGSDQEWIRFLAASGAVLLTFLAGAELEPAVLRSKAREVLIVGAVGFVAPFLGCAAAARFLLHWDPRASWLAGVALSTTSMAVVYAVMLETGLNRTEFGKGILGACFVNDLGTVLALGIIFAPFTMRTAIFGGVTVVTLAILPGATRLLTRIYGHRTAAVRIKWVLLVLFGLGALALWAGSEAVLPAYVAGMLLAGQAAEDHHWVRRVRTLTVGFLTPFYFLRAGSLVSLPAIAAGALPFVVLLGGKVASKIIGLNPVIRQFRSGRGESWYYTLLMSTGLTFGTISALYGLTHGIVTRAQYSLLVAVVIASAVIPTLIANAVFLPRHLMLPSEPAVAEEPEGPESE